MEDGLAGYGPKFTKAATDWQSTVYYSAGATVVLPDNKHLRLRHIHRGSGRHVGLGSTGCRGKTYHNGFRFKELAKLIYEHAMLHGVLGLLGCWAGAHTSVPMSCVLVALCSSLDPMHIHASPCVHGDLHHSHHTAPWKFWVGQQHGSMAVDQSWLMAAPISMHAML